MTLSDQLPNHTRLLGSHWLKLVDRLGLGAFAIDLDRRIVAHNDSLLKLLALDETATILGRSCREVFQEVPCHTDCPLESGGGAPPESLEFEILDSGRQPHLVTRMSSPLYDDRGNLAGCMTVLQDHSALAELINRVNYDVRSLKIILDNLNIGIFTVNRGGLITFFNTQAEVISGYDRRDILGKSTAVLFDEGTESRSGSLSKCMAQQTPRTNRKIDIVTKDGLRVTIRADYMPLVNDQGGMVGGLVTMQDMTLAQQLFQVISNGEIYHNMVGRDPTMQKVFETIRVVADSDATVLIEGATGTGKDLVARAVHAAGPHPDRPMVKVNCAAIPENLLESELFGYVKGAFSGAERDKPGRFQEADGGTIFLDEIGDLPLHLQAKLLRVLDDKEFYPLGSRRTVKVNVRVVSATNRDLSRLVEQKLFREDLYYRLNVVRIELPALKDRRADLPLLIRHLARKLCAGRKLPPRRIAEEAMELLLGYDYPGNIRELENILEHALIVCQENEITPRYLQGCMHKGASIERIEEPARKPPEPPERWEERDRILKALRKYNWRRGRTASALGIDRTTLWRKMKKYGLAP